MPRPRKYKDAGDRYQAFLDRNPGYTNSDRINEQKREWDRKNRPECPRCDRCGARLKGEKSRALGVCRNCQRKRKSSC
jgi:hypothetical protein